MTTTLQPNETLVHLWQDQGLGVAPFSVHCVISIPSKSLCEANPNAYNSAMAEACGRAKALGVHLCSCESCGMSLEHNVVIRDANKKFFVVGMDCAMKTGDSKVITQVENLERLRQKALREAKATAAREVRQQARLAELAAQRKRNDGLTDAEVAQHERAQAIEALKAQNAAKYRWLLDVLNQVSYSSDFVRSMIDLIEARGIAALSPKCQNILADIYAKTITNGAKRGSKKYDEALNAFGVNLSLEFAEAR